MVNLYLSLYYLICGETPAKDMVSIEISMVRVLCGGAIEVFGIPCMHVVIVLGPDF